MIEIIKYLKLKLGFFNVNIFLSIIGIIEVVKEKGFEVIINSLNFLIVIFF